MSSPEIHDREFRPSVSVIVPAFNAAATIEQCLRALCALDYGGPLEILVVDDGSADGTGEIVSRFAGVRLIRQDNAGPAAARNRGAKESQSDIICFTDADCVVHKDWVERLVSHFDKPGVAAVAGSYGIANPQKRLARGVHSEILYRHRHLVPDYPRVFGSYNVALRREIFNQAGGFDESYRFASGEDNDLSYKILAAGHKIFFDRGALVDHYHPVSVKKYLKEQYRHGFWRAKMYLRHPSMVRGDDYTFWKDGAEAALAAGIFVALAAGVIFCHMLKIGAGGLIVLILIEILYARRFGGDLKDAGFYALVMVCRSFVRAAGLLRGGLHFIR